MYAVLKRTSQSQSQQAAGHLVAWNVDCGDNMSLVCCVMWYVECVLNAYKCPVPMNVADKIVPLWCT